MLIKAGKWIVLFCLLVYSAGCASIVTFKLPDEFKDRKTQEDPQPH